MEDVDVFGCDVRMLELSTRILLAARLERLLGASGSPSSRRASAWSLVSSVYFGSGWCLGFAGTAFAVFSWLAGAGSFGRSVLLWLRHSGVQRLLQGLVHDDCLRASARGTAQAVLPLAAGVGVASALGAGLAGRRVSRHLQSNGRLQK